MNAPSSSRRSTPPKPKPTGTAEPSPTAAAPSASDPASGTSPDPIPDTDTDTSADPTSGPAIDAPGRRRLPILLRHAWYGLNQAFRRRIAHTGVTPDQFTVMRTLLEGDPKGLTQRELTVRMASDPNTIASLLERMAANGLLERKPHERDRRAHRIRLLAPGRRKYKEVREIAVALQEDALAGLPEAAREPFLEQLNIVAEACRLAADEAPKRAG